MMFKIPTDKRFYSAAHVMPSISISDEPVMRGPAIVSDRQRAGRRVPPLSKDQSELIRIRQELGMTRKSFAMHLQITESRLASYEYGRTKTVPEHIMKLAREVLASGLEEAQRRQNLFGSVPMSSILKRWAESLHVDYEDDHTLSILISVTETTVRRWKKNEARPRDEELMRKQLLVERQAEQIKKASTGLDRLVFN